MKSNAYQITLAAVALGALALPSATFAQDATPPAPPAASMPMTTTPATMPAAPMSFEPSWRPADESLDYRKLYNPCFNSIDLQEAKADHLSDNQVAAILKIAEETDLKFDTILSLVEEGQTFSLITQTYGLNGWTTVHDVQKQKDEIAAYLSAYGATGEHNGRRGLLQKALAEGNMQTKM